MTTFRYYLTNISNGTVLGTDNTETAEEWAMMGPDAFVCDTETGEWLVAEEDGLKRLPVGSMK